MEQATNEQHVEADGDECPFCRSTRIEGVHAANTGAGGAWQDIVCADCGKQWVDCYNLVGYVVRED